MEENQFDYVLCNFKPDKLFIREAAGFSASSNVMKAAEKIQTASELPDDVPLIFFAPIHSEHWKPDVSLLDFEHPENATYMFGPNNRNTTLEDDFGGRKPDKIVYIPTDTTDDMYNWVSIAIALWDRKHG